MTSWIISIRPNRCSLQSQSGLAINSRPKRSLNGTLHHGKHIPGVRKWGYSAKSKFWRGDEEVYLLILSRPYNFEGRGIQVSMDENCWVCIKACPNEPNWTYVQSVTFVHADGPFWCAPIGVLQTWCACTLSRNSSEGDLKMRLNWKALMAVDA